MIIESKHSFLALSTVIKGQHNHQGEANGRGQGQCQEPIEQCEAWTLGGPTFWMGLGRFAAAAGQWTL
jgi:hypothetical protein